jgi:hypothetical protein
VILSALDHVTVAPTTSRCSPIDPERVAFYCNSWEAPMSNEPNHARDRIWEGGQPYTRGANPGPADWRRWILKDAERIVAAEKARINDPPKPEA